MAAAALLARRRGRPYTRARGWIGAAAGAALAALLGVGWAATQLPSTNDPRVRAAVDSAVAEQQRRADAAGPNAVERVLERAMPGATAASRASEAQTRAMVGSPAFRWWTVGMSLVFLAGFAAVYVGTLGWAAGTVLAYAATGRWPARGGAPRRPAGATDDPIAWADAG